MLLGYRVCFVLGLLSPQNPISFQNLLIKRILVIHGKSGPTRRLRARLNLPVGVIKYIQIHNLSDPLEIGYNILEKYL